MKGRKILVALMIAAAVGTGCASYFLLQQQYGVTTKIVWGDASPIPWENAEQIKPEVFSLLAPGAKGPEFDVPIENADWLENLMILRWLDAQQQKLPILTYYSLAGENQIRLTAWEKAERDKPPVIAYGLRRARPEAWSLGHPRPPSPEAYRRETVVPFTIVESKPVGTLPMATGMGILAGAIVAAVWVGYRRLWGDITSVLLERGLHNMTVRDVEIVGQIAGLREFTIPEVMRRTRASKITVWRVVQKLMERGLVKPTDRSKPSCNGLGGRGKPSRVYVYVGEGSEG